MAARTAPAGGGGGLLVYLDQNYASRIAKHLLALPGQEAFGEVWEALLALGDRVVAPPSPFHVLELHGGYLLPTFRRLFAQVSQGYWVRPWRDVVRRQARRGGLLREDFLWRRGSWEEPADLAPLWGLLDLELEGDFYQRAAAARAWARERLGLGRAAEAAPFLQLLGRLAAFRSLEPAREERASDLLDLVMAATVAPYVDALATDRYLREALARVGAGVSVWSGRTGEVRALASRLESGRGPGLRLVGLTFFLSIFVTNDVALLAVLPVSLRLHGAALETLAVLEVLAANAGSALSPVGNPQNLFLYWFYGVPLGRFVAAIAPFSLFFLPLLALLAWLWDRRNPVRPAAPAAAPDRGAAVYLVLLVLFLPVVLRWVPAWLALLAPLVVALADRAALGVDYALLATFAVFFGLTDNLRAALAPAPLHPQHVFLSAALLSQLISNVPAALLLADFTRDWPALLWGVSVGGFGTLLASLANLIGYRLVRQDLPQRASAFLLRLHLLGFAFLILGLGLYWIAGPG